VLPGEVRAQTVYGEAGAGFGTALAVRGERWIVSAPGGRDVPARVAVYDGDTPVAELARSSPVSVWFDGEEPTAAFAFDGVYRLLTGERLQETPDARLFAGGDGVAVSASETQVRALDGRSWALERVQALAVGEERILALACADGCQAYELLDEPVLLGTAGELGRVGIWDGVAWWSDPELASADGAGVVMSEAGDRIEGLPGDHLGRSIGGGYAVGALNPNVAPVRARIAPLEAGAGWLAVDRARETRPLVLAGDDGWLLVGVPEVPAVEGLIGAVHRVEREALP